MGTIEIHEPEGKEVKPAGRPTAAVLPKSELAPAKFPPRPMFSDSILKFGQQNQTPRLRHDYIFYFELLGRRFDADRAAALQREPAQRATVLLSRGAASSASPTSSSGRAGADGNPADPDGSAQYRTAADSKPDSAEGADDSRRRSAAADAGYGRSGGRSA